MNGNKNAKRESRGYSCLPRTHDRLEKLRMRFGLKSVGHVLDKHFGPKAIIVGLFIFLGMFSMTVIAEQDATNRIVSGTNWNFRVIESSTNSFIGYQVVFATNASDGILFLPLVDTNGVVLMTNAEFRCVLGNKLCFRNGLSDYRSFPASELDHAVLVVLHLSLDQLATNQVHLNERNAELRTANAVAQKKLEVQALALQRAQQLIYENNQAHLGERLLAAKVAESSTPFKGAFNSAVVGTYAP